MTSEDGTGGRLVPRVIDASLKHCWLVMLACIALFGLALYGALDVRLDALPDLSDTQVILKAEAPGQSPQLVEDQVTYAVAAALLGVPGANTVRAVSMYGEAFVYVVFGGEVSPAQARLRVLERLPQIQSRLPQGASVAMGADASGTGWVFQYALRSKHLDASRLRAINDFEIRPQLQSVPGVAEVAGFGGATRQLQVEFDANRLQAAGLGPGALTQALRDANQVRGGAALEIGRQRHFIDFDARIRGPSDLLTLLIGQDSAGQTLRLHQVARVFWAPGPREGVADLDGQGDAVGGIVVMRQGENADQTIRQLKTRLASLQSELPADLELVTTYDRSGLIHSAVRSLGLRLLEEAGVVVVVCGLFLWRLRSALVAIVGLPLGLVVAVGMLERQGITANIMSLGGLAIAIGAMIDASVVMVETLHRKLEQPGAAKLPHLMLVREAAVEVGPALFFSLLIITLSFLPVFSLQGQEGRLFAPLALTKTYAMAAAAGLSVTLVPILMLLFVKGPMVREHRNPLNRGLRRLYRPMLIAVLNRPRATLCAGLLVGASLAWPLSHMGSEFMPALDEGELLYMPTTGSSISVDEAADILNRTSAAIRAQPEVASVHGKAGRSDSATDPAPLSMFETTVRLKPRAEWPDPKLPMASLIAQLDERVRLPGMTPSWGYPIRTRIDMLATGVKTPLALRIGGSDLASVEALAQHAEQRLQGLSGVRSAIAERSSQGRFVDIEFDRVRADAYGVRAADVAQLVSTSIGGEPVDTISIGRERYPLVARLPREQRDSLAAMAALKLRSASGSTVALGDIARLRLSDGPVEIKSENARPVAYVLIDLDAGADVGATLGAARKAIAGLKAESCSMEFVGQYLRLQDAAWRLGLISAGTLACVAFILFVHFRDGRRVLLVLAGLPAAAAGGLWLCWAMGLQWSFAVVVGLIALAGVAAEFCVVMLLYLDQEQSRRPDLPARLSILRGALLRLRPKAMTVAVILGGLLPLLLSQGVGVDVMRRIAAPMVGGMLTAPLFSLLVVPAAYRLFLVRELPHV
ncbi:MAG: efflux RND transporter permease subunit [Burkholderiaceae bacterium]|nr:efflux RND transporter permease subunit [Burkholderiaceae bacterium]